MPRDHFQRSTLTRTNAHVTIFSVLSSPEAEILTKNKKKFLKIWQRIIILTKNEKEIFENLAKNHRAVTSADAHVTIFSVLPSPDEEILTKNKKIFENGNELSCGDVSNAHVTIFSVLSQPEAEILTKTKKNF
ncbi:hypothetical protein PUN28_003701 [Cardiocondyla obscurior]|uniref:Uncharacterized protein n=1 Tax=Cardiocondyla obscurior TaxID=286306 RepID=A0AAW2GN06_9HYME